MAPRPPIAPPQMRPPNMMPQGPPVGMMQGKNTERSLEWFEFSNENNMFSSFPFDQK